MSRWEGGGEFGRHYDWILRIMSMEGTRRRPKPVKKQDGREKSETLKV